MNALPHCFISISFKHICIANGQLHFSRASRRPHRASSPYGPPSAGITQIEKDSRLNFTAAWKRIMHHMDRFDEPKNNPDRATSMKLMAAKIYLIHGVVRSGTCGCLFLVVSFNVCSILAGCTVQYICRL